MEGYKTYILAALIMIAGVLRHFQVIDSETFQALLAVLGGGAALTLRSGISAVDKKVKMLQPQEPKK